VNLKDLIDYCRSEAISSKLSPTEESFWRNSCRIYSKNFNTPLHVVLEMAPEHVILNVIEDNIQSLDLDEDLDHIIEMINELEDPDYHANKKKAMDAIEERIREEEKLRLKEGRPVHANMAKVKKEPTLTPPALTTEERKGGFVNMDYLSQNENER